MQFNIEYQGREGGGCAMGLKSRHHQKAHAGSILNLYTKFQLPISIRSGVMQEINPKNVKKRPNNYIFGTVRK